VHCWHELEVGIEGEGGMSNIPNIAQDVIDLWR